MAYFRCGGTPADVLALPTIGEASQAYICQFNTDLIMNLLECICEIKATQSGSGTPSPANPRAINGYSELNLVRCGKNLIDDAIRDFNGGAISFSTSTYGKTIWLPAGTYTFSVVTADGTSTNLYGKNLDTSENIFTQYSAFSKTFTLASACNVSFWVYKAGYTSVNDITSAQVELGSTATAYEPYNGTTFTVSFGQTVYGGVYDKSGRTQLNLNVANMDDLNWVYDASVPRFYTTDLNSVISKPAAYDVPNMLCSIATADYFNHLYNSLTNNIIAVSTDGAVSVKCTDYSDVPSFVAMLSGQKLVYELATPIEIDVSELSVDTIVGVNNVYADTGKTQCKFFETVGHHID